MYWSRLKIFLVLALLVMIVLGGRLVQLQIFGAESYRREAEGNLIRLPGLLTTHRGSIADRNGLKLAYDTPRFDVSMYYPFLAIEDEQLLRRLSRRTPADLERLDLSPTDDLREQLAPLWLDDDSFIARQADAMNLSEEEFRAEMSQFWPRLAEAAGISIDEIDDTRFEIMYRVHAIRENVRRRQGRRMIIREESYGTRSSIPHVLLPDIDEPTKAAMASFRSRYAFLVIEQHPRRSYPYGNVAAHIVGYVNQVKPEEIGSIPRGDHAGVDEELLEYRSDDERGRTGIEASMEHILRGRRGKEQYDKSDRPLWRIEPQPGGNVRLTLDSTFQMEVEALLDRPPELPADGGVVRGAAVVISIPSGEILAMATTPRFDPNTLGRDYADLSRPEAGRPFVNRAISQYPLGSIFKGITATAALHEGVVSPHTEIICTGRYSPHLDRYRCNNIYGHGAMSLIAAMRVSCNVYFYHLGVMLSSPRLVEWAGRFGLGQKTGLMIGGEAAGNLDAGDDPKNIAIGQGAILVTPLQAARFAGMLATGGKMNEVHLVKSPRPSPPPLVDMSLDESHMKIVRKAWAEVVSGQGGTGRRAYSDRVSIAGKTGSAQDPPRASHAWFVGFAPVENPQIAFAVFYQNAGGGGTVAAPVAKKIVERALDMGLIK